MPQHPQLHAVAVVVADLDDLLARKAHMGPHTARWRRRRRLRATAELPDDAVFVGDGVLLEVVFSRLKRPWKTGAHLQSADAAAVAVIGPPYFQLDERALLDFFEGDAVEALARRARETWAAFSVQIVPSRLSLAAFEETL
jgi:hypothetical protein